MDIIIFYIITSVLCADPDRGLSIGGRVSRCVIYGIAKIYVIIIFSTTNARPTSDFLSYR